MATIRIKFRISTVEKEEGRIFYQTTHNRTVRQYKTEYSLFPHEWNNRYSCVINNTSDTAREEYLNKIGDNIKSDIEYLRKIISKREQKRTTYTVHEIIEEFKKRSLYTLFTFTNSIIARLREMGKIRICETYTTTM